jgi:hypothetical protein
VGAAIGALQAGLVVNVTCHNLGTELGEGLGLVGFRVAGDGPDGKSALGIVEDGADESATLGASGADYCDDFFGSHGNGVVGVSGTIYAGSFGKSVE